jgi:hypothetical protein
LTPNLELDHVFVSAPRRSRDVALLAARGLAQGAARIHQGQGTANTCFFFDNAYLELIWSHNESEIRSALVEPLALWERTRWRETDACPFGVAFRSRDNVEQPRAAWGYAAPFLPAGKSLPIITPPGSADDPMIFFSTGSAGPPSGYPPEREVPLVQSGRRRTLRVVCLQVRANAVSDQVCAAEKSGLLSIETGKQPHMRLEFEAGREEVDFRPELPLSLIW